MPDLKSASSNKIDKPKTILIDLDDTVYPASSGVWLAIQARMEKYMLERLRIPPQDVPAMRRDLYLKYGTTLRGLQVTRHIDELDFLSFVHDVPVCNLLTPDQAVREALLKISQPKFIFTNADRHHARRVLEVLELSDCFEGIIDILDIAPYCKPMPEAFQIAMKLANVTDPQDCIFIDDGLHNLAGARKLGIFTIHVGGDVSPDQCDASIQSLVQLPAVLQTLSTRRP